MPKEPVEEEVEEEITEEQMIYHEPPGDLGDEMLRAAGEAADEIGITPELPEILGAGEPLVADEAPEPEVEWLAVRLGQRFSLGVGETAVVEKGMIWVTFNEILEDSRCPSDAVCVWAGRVVVSLSLHHNDGNLLDLELSEWDDNEYSHQAEVEGLLVQVLRVEPLLETGVTIEPEDYTVTLVVEAVP